MNRKFTCIDLFSGAGGLSRGFLDAGYDVLLGVDFDDAALRTFKANHDGSEAMKLDLFDHNNIDKIEMFLKQRNLSLDVLIGGPPCQGFSVAGPRDMNDKRNSLYLAMVKLAKRLKPQAVILENVPGMIQTNDGIGAKRIVNDFAEIGYKMVPKLLYAPDYGIPQIRKRVFFVGLRDAEKEYDFPKPLCTPENYITCEDAISDLPSLVGDVDMSLDTVREYMTDPQTEYQATMRKNSSKVYNHTPTNHAQKTVDNIALVPDGGKYTDLPKEIAGKFKYHESLHRYNSKKPSLTIDTGHRTHFHYKYNRIPTVRENARLQSFPDDFIFYGNKQEQYKQVGNAVPPILGKVVALKLKEYLK